MTQKSFGPGLLEAMDGGALAVRSSLGYLGLRAWGLGLVVWGLGLGFRA